MKPLTAALLTAAELSVAGFIGYFLVTPPVRPTDWALALMVGGWGCAALGTAYVGLVRPALLKRKAGEGRG